MLMRILKAVLGIIGLFLLYVVVVLTHGTLTDWQPPATATIELDQSAAETVLTDSVFSVAIWNMGFGGLGAESDFFYDDGGFFLSHGRMIRSPHEYVEKNVNGAELFAQSTAADFFLFQEVDQASRRSYFKNEYDSLRLQQPDFSAAFSANYKVARVPIPLLEPWRAYGRVHSGLATLSKWQPYESQRLQLPGSFGWPTHIFQLDRCLLLQRYETAFGNDLVLINAHLSAYDSGGGLKKQQMDFLQALLTAEYEAGNYVIVGCDWNQCPPNFQFDSFSPGKTDGFSQINIAQDYLPDDWQWIYDPTTPTNRKARTPYDPEKSFTTLIDFFLISPNLKALEVKGINQDFRFSDHQPVWMKVSVE